MSLAAKKEQQLILEGNFLERNFQTESF